MKRRNRIFALLLVLSGLVGCGRTSDQIEITKPETNQNSLVDPIVVPDEPQAEKPQEETASKPQDTSSNFSTVAIGCMPKDDTGSDAKENSLSAYDLEFYFSCPGVGNYYYTIGPEGSDERVILGPENCAGSCSYARENHVELGLSKYCINFETPVSDLWCIRTISRSSNNEVLEEWHNIPITDNCTLIHAVSVDLRLYPATEDAKLTHMMVVDKMELCDSCPDDWKNADAGYEELLGQAMQKWASEAEWMEKDPEYKVTELIAPTPAVRIEDTYVEFVDIIARCEDGSYVNVSPWTKAVYYDDEIILYDRGRVDSVKPGKSFLEIAYGGHSVLLTVEVTEQDN